MSGIIKGLFLGLKNQKVIPFHQMTPELHNQISSGLAKIMMVAKMTNAKLTKAQRDYITNQAKQVQEFEDRYITGIKDKAGNIIKEGKEKVAEFFDLKGRKMDPTKSIIGGEQAGIMGIEKVSPKFIEYAVRNIKEMKNPQSVKDEINFIIKRQGMYKNLTSDDAKQILDAIDPIIKKADGGRIGLKDGEGIMQMASVDDPFYRDSEADRDDFSFRMFNKPYKELNEDELEEFQEEMMRLMNKFSSAPDPMADRNDMMENLSRRYYNKPLKDLTDDEIIELEEAFDDLTTKKDRGAPSITLADGGRAAFKEGLRAKLMKPFKIDRGTLRSMFFNKNNPIISGFNTSELFDIVSQISSLPGLAEGGRIGYKDGPKNPRRRTFMKAAAGIASMIPGLGMLGKGAKVAAPVVAKAAEITGPALAKIVDTVMSLGKLVSVKGRRVKEMVTKKKHDGVEVTEDIQDGSYIIKKGNKEIYYKPGKMDETGGIDDDIIQVIDKTITKKASGGIARMLGE